MSNYPFCGVCPAWNKGHSSVKFAALVLLQQLKLRFPTAWASLGHRLFVSARIKGHLWQHLLQQVMVNRCTLAGQVPVVGDQSDEKRNMSVSQVGVKHRLCH